MTADEGMFVRVACPSCGRADVYLKCDRCGRQSLFSLSADGVRCNCGASYSHGVCGCGAEVPPAHLVAVPFEQGPKVWSELELDPARVGALALVAVFAVAAVGWWWLT